MDGVGTCTEYGHRHGITRRRVVGLALATIAGVAEAGRREDAVRRIASALIAPCCFQQTLADHHSELAERLRAEIADLLARGRSEEQIVAGFVARYGERILASPAPRGFNLLAYAIPPLLVAVAVTTLLVRMRRAIRRPLVVEPAGAFDPAARAAIEAALRAYDPE